MKKISLLVIFVLSFLFIFSQSVVQRSSPSNTPLDPNLFTGRSFKVPVFDDTLSANTLFPTLDSAGKIIFTRDINWFWGRQTSPARKWVPFLNSSTQLFQTCGLPNGTHIVTWDSLLVFDVTGGPYVLCCDGIPRSTGFATVTLPAADPDNPRVDAIILDQNGLTVLQGIAQPNPAVPQIDSCQILLSYVLVNAGQTVPAFVSQNNPLSIYDENYQPQEWLLDTVSQVTIDTANTAFPVHLTHDMILSGAAVGSYFIFETDSTINLTDYGALKFYVRTTESTLLSLYVSWYLDGVPKTMEVQTTISSNSSTVNTYTPVVISTAAFNFLSSPDINQLKIRIINAGSAPFYIDWIQLQSGIPPPVMPQGLTAFGAGALSPIFTTTVTNPNTQPFLSFNLSNACSYCYLGNNTNVAAPPTYGKINLAQGVIDTLALTNIQIGCDGCYFGTSGGTNGSFPFLEDTTFLENWLYRSVDPNSDNDTLRFGSRYRDSSTLKFNTLTSLNGFNWTVTRGMADVFKISSNGADNGIVALGNSRFEEAQGVAIAAANNLTLGNDGNVFSITGNTQINAITTANWQAGSQVELIFTGTPTVKNNTAGGVGTATILLAGSVDFTVAANDVLSLVYDGINWHESARKTSASIVSMLGRNGVTDSVDRIILGGTLYKNTSIAAGANLMTWTFNSIGAAKGFNITSNSTAAASNSQKLASIELSGANATSGQQTYALNVSNSHTGATSSNDGILVTVTNGATLNIGVDATVSGASTNYGLRGTSNATGSYGVVGQTSTGVALSGVASSTGTGIEASSGAGGLGGIFTTTSASDNVITDVMLIRNKGTAAGNGIGLSLDFDIVTSTNNIPVSNQIISKWTDATFATRTSQMTLTGVLSAATVDLMTWNANGSVQWRPITATAASAITPVEGMQLFVSTTDATFTSIGMWDYENGAWHKL